MDNYEKIRKGIKIAKIVGILLIIIIIIALIVVFYNKHKLNEKIEKNTSDFTSYLLQNGFTKNNDGSYSKSETNGNENTNYLFYPDDDVLSKEIVNNSENLQTNLLLSYNNDNKIEISYDCTGLNDNNQYGSTLQMGTYNIETKKFECEIVTNDNFKTNCKNMKTESEEFAEEVEVLLKGSNSDSKYINKKN
jgi:hypothetical protein